MFIWLDAGTVLHTLTGDSAGFGSALADIGDINGDGIDALIGSPQADTDDNGTPEQWGRGHLLGAHRRPSCGPSTARPQAASSGSRSPPLAMLTPTASATSRSALPGAGAGGGGRSSSTPAATARLHPHPHGRGDQRAFGSAILGTGDIGATSST